MRRRGRPAGRRDSKPRRRRWLRKPSQSAKPARAQQQQVEVRAARPSASSALISPARPCSSYLNSPAPSDQKHDDVREAVRRIAVEQHAISHVRPEQMAAIESLVESRADTVVKLRTGGGKTFVALCATRLIRERQCTTSAGGGGGAAIFVMPTLSLVLQISIVAAKCGLVVRSFSSASRPKRTH